MSKKSKEVKVKKKPTHIKRLVRRLARWYKAGEKEKVKSTSEALIRRGASGPVKEQADAELTKVLKAAAEAATAAEAANIAATAVVAEAVSEVAEPVAVETAAVAEPLNYPL
jgi:hypothetical protein